jgi:hypothetical protein
MPSARFERVESAFLAPGEPAGYGHDRWLAVGADPEDVTLVGDPGVDASLGEEPAGRHTAEFVVGVSAVGGREADDDRFEIRHSGLQSAR